MDILNESFFRLPALEVARRLLGQTLSHQTKQGRISGRIVEAEAYIGEEDLACHARAGRTARTEFMYGPPGHAYIYLTYGMYWMLNVVVEPEEYPAAVLIRAIEPLEGEELMLGNRLRGSSFHKLKRELDADYLRKNLTNGPARLCLAYGITGELGGANLMKSPLRIEPVPPILDSQTQTSKRIGIAYAGKCADQPWRFFIRDNPWVSKPKAQPLR